MKKPPPLHCPTKKLKVNLADYNYIRDIENRLLMSSFTAFDVEVLEEILHSPLNIKIDDLLDFLEVERDCLLNSLSKLIQSALFRFVDEDTLTVDKEMRKYYEFQVRKFEDDFAPDMEFLAGLLKRVPIHHIPTWYAIPRTSNDIFASIVEKYLETPQTFQRYKSELNFEDETLQGILDEVFESPSLEVRASDLRERFELSSERLQYYLLHLEFCFLCCLSYRKEGDRWVEVVTPFHEAREYLSFCRKSEPCPISAEESIHRLRNLQFGFVRDMSAVLRVLSDHPLPVQDPREYRLADWTEVLSHCQNLEGDVKDPETQQYLAKVTEKLCTIKLAEVREDSSIHPLEPAQEWLGMPEEDKAMMLFRAPLNRRIPAGKFSDRDLRSIEGSLSRVAHLGWIYYDDFIKGMVAPIGETEGVRLKKTGRRSSYALPQYSDEERCLIDTTMDWLFEMFIVDLGFLEEKKCLKVTDFGRTALL